MAEKLVFNYNKLRGAMKEKGFILETLSEKTGIGMSTLSTKMARGNAFNCDQAWRIAKALELETVDPYFFNAELCNLKSSNK